MKQYQRLLPSPRRAHTHSRNTARLAALRSHSHTQPLQPVPCMQLHHPMHHTQAASPTPHDATIPPGPLGAVKGMKQKRVRPKRNACVARYIGSTGSDTGPSSRSSSRNERPDMKQLTAAVPRCTPRRSNVCSTGLQCVLHSASTKAVMPKKERKAG